MSMNNLSIDGEFRYIIQWFNEWSELQRDDFVPVLVEYLVQGSPGEVYMNGMVNAVNHAGIQDKPMSLFQCRIKLFREWNKKWPLELKHKLQEKIMEMDSKVAEKVIKEIKIHGGEEINIITNGCNGNGSDMETSLEAELENVENLVTAASNAASTEAAADAINLDSQIVAVLNNETPVDDNNITSETYNADNTTTHSDDTTTVATTYVNAIIDTQLVRLEPAEQLQQQSVLEDNIIVNEDCNATTTTATVA